jgi:hypothetical protein
LDTNRFIHKIINRKTILVRNVFLFSFIVYISYGFLDLCANPPGSFLYPMRYIYRNEKGPTHILLNDLSLYNLVNNRLHMSYYKRTDANYVYVQNQDAVVQYAKTHKNTIVLMISSRGFGWHEDFFRINRYLEPEYFQFPHYLKIFDVNNWIERTNFWRVYKVTLKPDL